MKNKIIRSNLLNFIFLTILGAFFLYSCDDENKNLSKTKSISVFSLDKENERLAEIVDSVSFLPLKEHKDFLFSYIDKLIIKNNRIYISNLSGSYPLLCFSMTGDFISNIGRPGAGPGEYTRFFDFDVDESKVYICDRNKKKLMTYDLEGNFLEENSTPFRVENFKILANQKILFSLQKEDKSKGGDLLILTKNDFSKEKVFLRYNENTTEDKITYNLFQTVGNTIFYNKSVNDTVYSFSDKGEPSQAYVFDFKDNKVPEVLKKSYSKLVEERKKNKYIYFPETPFFIGNVVTGLIFNGQNKATLFLDSRTNEYAIKDWIPNELGYKDLFLPVFSDGNYIVGWLDKEVYQLLKEKPTFTKETMKHLEEGGKLLVFYHLKK